jgi:RimJ/RimL family protein N-acetyltransferase
MARSAPTLDTDRLVLRAHVLADFDDSAAMWGDPAVTRHIGGKTSTREESWRRFLGFPGHWALMGFGYWAVRERATERYVGEVGVAEFRRELVPSIEGSGEAGWVLAPWAHGKGFATEAVRAALAWYARPTACLIDEKNVPSLRVAAKCGYAEVARPVYHGTPGVLLRRDVNPASG